MAMAPMTTSVDLSRAVSYQKKSRGFGLGGLFSKVGDVFSRTKSKKSAGNTSALFSKIKVGCLL